MAGCHAHVTTEKSRSVLLRCILQLLQRADFDTDACRLGSKPLVLSCKRILAKAFGLGGDLLSDDLHQAREREFAEALLVQRAEDGRLQTAVSLRGPALQFGHRRTFKAPLILALTWPVSANCGCKKNARPPPVRTFVCL